jgi:uncharacterized RmlC-like cupin family protein
MVRPSGRGSTILGGPASLAYRANRRQLGPSFDADVEASQQMGNEHDEDHELDPGTSAWHFKLHHTRHDELSEDTGQTPGMRRYEAISGKLTGSRKIWMGKNHVGPGLVSADHHHGEAETGIYVVSGHPVFVFLENGRERRIETGPGDYVYVPPFVPHREENPSLDEEAVVVLARSTQEGIVVNLPSLRAQVPELDALIAEARGGPDGNGG